MTDRTVSPEAVAPEVDMMASRRAALDRLADAPLPATGPFEGVRVELAEYRPTAASPGTVPAGLADAVAGLLVRDGASTGPGAAVVAGLAHHFPLSAARVFHEALFRAVWDAFCRRTDRSDATTGHRIKTGTISDGAIPVELYGSSWSFKRFHIDRDALLFSHLYGPVTGFAGGELLLVDIRPYLARRSLRFDDAFEWSDEPTAGAKPVLRADHGEPALAECGIDLGAVGPDEIVFVNNLPDAGILHGVRPVTVTDPDTFQREYHRCSVKELQ